MNFQIHMPRVAANEVAGGARRISSGGRCRQDLVPTMIVQISGGGGGVIYHQPDQIFSSHFFFTKYRWTTWNEWTCCLTKQALHVPKRKIPLNVLNSSLLAEAGQLHIMHFVILKGKVRPARLDLRSWPDLATV